MTYLLTEKDIKELYLNGTQLKKLKSMKWIEHSEYSEIQLTHRAIIPDFSNTKFKSAVNLTLSDLGEVVDYMYKQSREK